MVGLGILGIFGLGASAAAVAVLVFFAATWLDRPLPVFGFDEGPDQPIAFPHTVHVQEMGLDCTFCHRNVTKGEAATIPAVNLCMSCHVAVGDGLPKRWRSSRTSTTAASPSTGCGCTGCRTTSSSYTRRT